MSEKTSEAEVKGCFCMGAGPQVSDMLRHLIPESAREHFRNSRVEMLKALRSLIDNRIEELTRQEKKGTTIVVE